MSEPVVLVDVSERIATVTLNRPNTRNALSGEVLRLLPECMRDADKRDDVDVIILTGADPAFCAGLDLKELGSTGITLGAGAKDVTRAPFPSVAKPVIGAINGVAVTGGLELALHCDFLIASERARFADTHARIGVMPGWGLTVLLPQAVGVRRARELSFTGNFLTAEDALAWGLVNHVVAHDALLPRARQIALDIVSNDQPGVRQIRTTYAAVAATTVAEGLELEARDSRAWQRTSFTHEEVARRRDAVIQRGRSAM